MVAVQYENIYNKEKFTCNDNRAVKVIDGVEYLKVFKEGTTREVFVRSDFLRKVNIK